MATTSYIRGHEVIYQGGEWLWADTRVPVDVNPRPCVRCGELPTAQGHDACLGTLEGIKHACCGHGVEEPYEVRA